MHSNKTKEQSENMKRVRKYSMRETGKESSMKWKKREKRR